MFKNARKIRLLVLCLVFSTLLRPQAVQADSPLGMELTAGAAILIEAETGKVLYEKNAHQRMYPASTIKILTAMILLDFFEPHEFITVGAEVHMTPPLSSVGGHFQGETLTVENAVRALFLPSGNDTSNTVARAVATRSQPHGNMTIEQTEQYFAGLMNDLARELGATNSNFVNAHGFHHPEQVATAADLAMITQAAIQNPVIARIAAETSFEGYGAGTLPDPDVRTRMYTWRSHNALLNEESDFYFPYATGFKTGFTTPAGHCLVATATKDGVTLISVVLYSDIPGRWIDSIALFEYGFATYAHQTVQQAGVLGEVTLQNVRLGYDDVLEFAVDLPFTAFLSEAELQRVQRTFVFDEALIAPPAENEGGGVEEEGETRIILLAPIEEGDFLGTVIYTLDGEIIHSDMLVATRTVEERTFASDMAYYWDLVTTFVFSLRGIILGLGLLLFIIIVFIFISKIKGQRRRRNIYSTRW